MYRRKGIGYMRLHISKCSLRNSEEEEMVSQGQSSEVVEKKVEANLEDALDLAGVGNFQVLHCLLMLSTLSSAILEIIGNAFILPAAACDLDLPEHLRGIITSVPSIGVILTAPLWGRLADSLGRKPVLLASSAAAGSIGLLASFMPDLRSYVICKFIGSLFLACPSSLGFAYAGEMVPRKRRDLSLLIVNGLLMMSSVFSPIFAWAILSFNWRFDVGTLILRPWRLLTASYAMPLIVSALCMTQAKESPKFLMTEGKHTEALSVLSYMFRKNTRRPAKEYSVTSLKETSEEPTRDTIEDGSEVQLARRSSRSAWALFRPPHLKWMALCGFLMFGLFSLLNGLFMFATDTINKAMRGSSDEEGTVCILMNQSDNQTITGVCKDEISHETFLIMVVTTVVYGVVVLGASLCPVSKKTLLVAMFYVNGVACLMSGLLTNRIVAGAAMSALQLTSLGVGPLTAYAVHLFPTHLRGTAVGGVLMCGRLGSVVGANAAGYFLAVACAPTFYGFTFLLFLCAAVSFLLPKDDIPNQEPSECIKCTDNVAFST